MQFLGESSAVLLMDLMQTIKISKQGTFILEVMRPYRDLQRRVLKAYINDNLEQRSRE